jgi:hypothetical protein
MKPHKKDLVRYIYALIDPRTNAVRYYSVVVPPVQLSLWACLEASTDAG